MTLRGFEHYGLENTPTFTTPNSIRIRTGSIREQSQGQAQTELPYPGMLCPPEKMLGILQALPAASTMAQDASDYVDGLYERVHAPGEIKYKFKQTPRYTTWFGIHGDPNVENKTNTRIRKVLSATADRVRSLKPSCECADEEVRGRARSTMKQVTSTIPLQKGRKTTMRTLRYRKMRESWPLMLETSHPITHTATSTLRTI